MQPLAKGHPPQPAPPRAATDPSRARHRRPRGGSGLVRHTPSPGHRGRRVQACLSPLSGRSDLEKVRDSDTVGADVVGYVGPASRPHRAAVRLPDGSRVLWQALTAPVAAEVARHFLDAGPERRARTSAGDAYATANASLVVEVLAGTTGIAVAQPRCTAYDVTANAVAHAEAVRAADARVVVFPEMSLTGYELDAVPVLPDDERLAPIVAACAETGALALVGAPVPGPRIASWQ
ncbi:nitrilase-related carbon-nitrogen hydrolase [Streptomyces sp. NPDC059262]|uniref:nitrilase-related carbon-nitrogen hydrolase n=1 Tax=Streptomyces sp. NPDC059262 TaxID=3346797 RepID=UPI0036C42D16